jgi:hypothetical protein
MALKDFFRSRKSLTKELANLSVDNSIIFPNAPRETKVKWATEHIEGTYNKLGLIKRLDVERKYQSGE